MFPAGFDKDDQMYSSTRFGDFPHYLPTKKWTNADELYTGWMLLSYKKPCTATSTLDTFNAGKITDENPRTYWVAAENKAGESVTIDLQEVFTVKAIQVNYTDYKSGIFASDSSVYTQFRLSESVDGKNWSMIADLSGEKRDRPNAYLELAQPVKTRYIRYEHIYVGAKNLAISDIRVFGNGAGKMPGTPTGFSVERDHDSRNGFVKWKKVSGVVGYNIFWGIAKEKLYETYQVFADSDTRLEIRALNVGQDYYFAIESFDENGVSALSDVVHMQ
jgi:hypothetical protein